MKPMSVWEQSSSLEQGIGQGRIGVSAKISVDGMMRWECARRMMASAFVWHEKIDTIASRQQALQWTIWEKPVANANDGGNEFGAKIWNLTISHFFKAREY